MKKNRVISIIAIIALLLILAVAGIFAYLTSTDTASNKFTVGKVTIDLKEDSWDDAPDTDNDGVPDFAENIVPNQTIAKDPKIKNTGENPAYVYLKVTVPVKKVVVANSDGTVSSRTPVDTELFTYTKKTGWTEIESERGEVKDSSNNVTAHTYVYYYNTALEKNAETTTLFDTVTFVNVIDNQVDAPGNYHVDVDAYAIQSNNLSGNPTIPAAYSIYVNQNNN